MLNTISAFQLLLQLYICFLDNNRGLIHEARLLKLIHFI
jgi:hypothetical protein